MIDQEMLEAMRQMMAVQEQRLMNGIKVLLENDVQTQINLVAEDVKAIREQLPRFDSQEELRNDVDVLKAIVKIHSEDIQALKKAQ